jgi:hypothetical protein
MRGNPELQTEAGRTGFEDPAAGKRSLWYHIAQVRPGCSVLLITYLKAMSVKEAGVGMPVWE